MSAGAPRPSISCTSRLPHDIRSAEGTSTRTIGAAGAKLSPWMPTTKGPANTKRRSAAPSDDRDPLGAERLRHRAGAGPGVVALVRAPRSPRAPSPSRPAGRGASPRSTAGRTPSRGRCPPRRTARARQCRRATRGAGRPTRSDRARRASPGPRRRRRSRASSRTRPDVDARAEGRLASDVRERGRRGRELGHRHARRRSSRRRASGGRHASATIGNTRPAVDHGQRVPGPDALGAEQDARLPSASRRIGGTDTAKTRTAQSATGAKTDGWDQAQAPTASARRDAHARARARARSRPRARSRRGRVRRGTSPPPGTPIVATAWTASRSTISDSIAPRAAGPNRRPTAAPSAMTDHAPS